MAEGKFAQQMEGNLKEGDRREGAHMVRFLHGRLC